jgi:uncharacterized protein (TIGR02466 family)
MMDSTQTHPNQFNLFYTPIWGYILKNEYYHSFNYIEFIEELESREPSAQKSNFGGWQSRDNLHEEGIFQELIKVIEMVASDAVRNYTSKTLKVFSMWANVNKHLHYNGSHVHEGELSGVFYLKVPPNSGRLILVNPAVRSEAHTIKEKNYPITPEPLACVLFPSWLSHYVEPNQSDDKRISLSFNLELS